MTPTPLLQLTRTLALTVLLAAPAVAQDAAQPAESLLGQVPAAEAPASKPAPPVVEPSDELKAAAHGRAPNPLVYPPATADQRSSWGLLLEGALLDSDNGKDFRETGGYYKLLSSLQAYTPQEIRERATRYLDWFPAMQDPNAWRGEFVHRRGVFTGARAIRLDRPVAGITDVWRCGIADGDGTEGIVFDVLEAPDAAIEKLDPIEIEGIFYRTVRYTSQDEKPHETPYLLVKNVRKIERGQQRSKGLFDGTALYVFGAALLFLGFRLVSVVRQQSRRGYNSRREPSLHETIEQRAAKHRRDSNAPPRNPPPS